MDMSTSASTIATCLPVYRTRSRRLTSELCTTAVSLYIFSKAPASGGERSPELEKLKGTSPPCTKMPPTGLHTHRGSRSKERLLHDLWQSLIASDLELVWKVQDAVRAWPPWMERNLSRIVSHYPLRDVSVVTWFAFLLGCRHFGFHFFWASCVNLVGAGFLRLLISAPRPFMYDQRLRPLTDRYETSHGLPSLETHMATVVVGWWAESGGSNSNGNNASDVGEGGQPLVRLLAVGYICFVGFTRVYACSRFVHQVVLSMMSGIIGLVLGWRLSTHLDGLGLMIKHHVRGTAVVVVIALGVMAYHVENNDSQLMGIKKQEYLRVLAGILNESRQAQNAMVGAMASDKDGGGAWESARDAPWDGGMAPSTNRRRRLEDRKDSFHFLQSSVERRASEKAIFNRKTTSMGEEAGLDADYRWGNEDRSGKATRGLNGERYFAAAERAWGTSFS